MRMFRGRAKGYVAGSVLILAATTMSMAGILSPGWLHFKSPTAENITSEGLFLECSGHLTACGPVNLLEIEGYEMWSHVIISLGVIALFVSSFFIFTFNCGAGKPGSRLKLVEGFGAYGGFLIFTGIVNYVANDIQQGGSSYSYAFFLTLLASLVGVTGSVLVALHHRVSSSDDVIPPDDVDDEEHVVKGAERETTFWVVSDDVDDDERVVEGAERETTLCEGVSEDIDG